jgi:hypothetical protein
MNVDLSKEELQKLTDQNEFCRKLVKEIDNYSLTQRQLYFLIYLLSLQLEDNEIMSEIASCVRERSLLTKIYG